MLGMLTGRQWSVETRERCVKERRLVPVGTFGPPHVGRWAHLRNLVIFHCVPLWYQKGHRNTLSVSSRSVPDILSVKVSPSKKAVDTKMSRAVPLCTGTLSLFWNLFLVSSPGWKGTARHQPMWNGGFLISL